MTSTTQGTFADKNSSRVLRPPGGGSSNIFAFATEDAGDDRTQRSTGRRPGPGQSTTAEPAVAQTKSITNSNEKSGDERLKEEQDLKDTPKTDSPSCNTDESNKTTKPAQPDVDRTSLAKRSQAGTSDFNIFSGAPRESEQKPANAQSEVAQSGVAQGGVAQSGIRIRQPPGGASSKLW